MSMLALGVGPWRNERVPALSGADPATCSGMSGDCKRESGGDRGSSLKCSVNLDVGRFMFPVGPNDRGGMWPVCGGEDEVCTLKKESCEG